LVLIILAVVLAGCGPTVGDACTTASDCTGKICINQDFTPGGYCSLACDPGKDDSCPTGSVCVRNALSNNVSACFHTCNTSSDCRTGYVCRTTNGSPLICVGPAGI
jgi:hypothetical protein